ncbi:LysR family transcriptional regulator [Thaumasiovibrio sp. DFM-14]|uniref:LysR family transcriptional regulator n=1 Tax=Thaumasiovibrio sp. DFM-14 TaxID=3384792 RepID=UPI00399FC2B9
MNNIEFLGLRALIAVIEEGSFTAAAEKLSVGKSNLSQQVSQLEERLGVQLLHRTTRKLRLTQEGEQFFHQARPAWQQLQLSFEQTKLHADELAGVIRVNTVGGLLGEEIIAPLLIAFEDAYPHVKVEFDFSSQKVDLLNTNYDLVLRMGNLPDSSLIARKAFSLRTVLVASPTYLKSTPSIVQPKDLEHHQLIVGSVKEWELTNNEETVKVHAHHGRTIANGRIMYQLATAHRGIARLSELYVKNEIKNHTLEEVLPNWNQTLTDIYLVCPPGKYQLKRIKALMDWLVLHGQQAIDDH